MNKKIGMFGVVLMLATLFAMTVDAAITGCYNESSELVSHKYNDTDVIKNVSAGNVCIDATDYDVNPTAAVKCGTWRACVANACSSAEYYVGFKGDGTTDCVDTDWQASGVVYNATADYIYNATVNQTGACSVIGTGKTATYTGCTNAYTRNGSDGYCDGAGSLDVDDASLHVAAGKVCANGANQAPNASIKCGTWSNCVAGQSTAAEYYVGYAASGTSCVDTSWVSAGTTQTATPGLRWRNTEHVDSCSTLGYAYNYGKSDLQPIVVDGLGTVGAASVSVIDLAVAALFLSFLGASIYGYMKNK